jgi:hypothetical protein
MRARRHALSTCLVLAALAAVAWFALPAAAQTCPDFTAACNTAGLSPWLGDLNNDGAVDSADVAIWNNCIYANVNAQGQVAYCPAGDFNFDGVIDTDDLNYLNQLVSMAADGSVGRLPKVQLNEVRVRKPSSQTSLVIPQSRYAEIRTPTGAANVNGAPTVNGSQAGDPASIKRFTSGWYYLKVCRASPIVGSGVVSGTVAVVQPLAGMPWIVNALDTVSRGLSLVADSSFITVPSPLLSAVPASDVPFIFPASGSLAIPHTAAGFDFPNEDATNVTHLIVFRNPSPLNTRAVPAVGQRVNVPSNVDPANTCDLAWIVTGAQGLPPWDAIVDAVTIIRGANVQNFGCVFVKNPADAIGPVGSVSNSYAPPHIYRCRNAGTVVKGVDSIYYDAGPPVVESDTPFARNPTCSTAVTGCGETDANGNVRDCFQPQTGPNCSDADCCRAVCQIDPRCCNTAWDSTCAGQAGTVCKTCGQSSASCFAVHQTPSCSDASCCSQVCSLDPSCCTSSWDSGCVSLASTHCLTCGVSGTGSCDEVHTPPTCSNADCCNKVCQINPFCCTTTWDQSCVLTAEVACASCGALNAGACCVAHAGPYCSDGQCCSAVCAQDPFCCNSAWDTSCAQIALVTPSCGNLGCVCGATPAPGDEGSCFIAHPKPGCQDASCCQSVCLNDPYCCFVAWDTACVAIAGDSCSRVAGCVNPATGFPVNGSCYVAHITPGCDKPGCCSKVCTDAAYGYCCQVIWDEVCAARATAICDSCGDPLAGSCFQQHAAPHCADGTCCAIVCNADPFCCSGTWDALCVTSAQVRCAAPINACGTAGRSCWIPNYTPGCSDQTCCRAICSNIDPFCCEARWDAVCAREATFICTPSFPVTIGREGCLTAHTSAGCANADCSRAVCSVDPSCCSVTWDQTCVLVATAVCTAPDGCPSTGDCFAPHSNPGCRDSSCCNGVCAADPTCCDGLWDAACVTLARTLCQIQPGSGWLCPCHGSCFATHDNGGCEDGSCCSVVCNISPTCCTVGWDSACVSLAREHCCGTPGCGSGCNKPCLQTHQEPYCADPYCCDAVCRADPLCCSATWDTLCVASAYDRCGSACGLEDSGDCFVQHDTAGCRTGACCGKVCAIDAHCCTVAWDAACVTIASRPELASVCVKPVCGDATAGSPCKAHNGQASSNLACCEAVCAQDSYCCNTQWDQSCADRATNITSCGCTYTCGDKCAGSCCSAHENGACDNPACCALVCAQDSYCCNVQWDSVCASTARSICSGAQDACPLPPCGSDLLPSCCVVSTAPNCSDATCCNRICAVDPFCCQSAWDIACVQKAQDPQYGCHCDGDTCGSSGTGNCFQVHATPYCNESGCCQTVCAYDPACCSTGWDAQCVSYAQFFCGSGFTGLLDYFRGGPLGDGHARAMPPAGWIPPRERAAMHAQKPLPGTVSKPERPAKDLGNLPRSDGSGLPPITPVKSSGGATPPAPTAPKPSAPAQPTTPAPASQPVKPPAAAPVKGGTPVQPAPSGGAPE